MGKIMDKFIAVLRIAVGLALLWLLWQFAENIAEQVLHTSDPSLSMVSFIWIVMVYVVRGLLSDFIRMF
ncbi:hypothetical protein [Shimazuella kribbensis]|uniref:hypothetical protein n=1 Tax=Shimazuella kribbensis TaxID=139808 RepID=UPI0004907F5D|nr:hypothetical protein [Shimazuella kribbensis]